jgi:hypothetical protein
MRVLNKRLWPYQFKMDVEHMEANDDRIIWLKDNLPKDDWRFNETNSTYCFAKNEDAVLFKLTCS